MSMTAVILQAPGAVNGYRWLVLSDSGDKYYLSGPGSPSFAQDKVGDTGTLTYVSCSTVGYYCWKTGLHHE